MNKQIKTLAYASVMAALIAVATMYIQIPIPMDKGYCNLGDALILSSGALLGPWAAAAAAVGSALSDLLLGYGIYAPVTAVIKGLMGLIAGLCCCRKMPAWQRAVLFVGAECLMVGGYFLFETLMYGASVAATSLFGNGCQAVAGAVAAMVLWPVMQRVEKLTR